MGTIQNIVDNLVRQSADKEAVLAERFEETSVWLANELELIRKIILKKPRGGLEAAAAPFSQQLGPSASGVAVPVMPPTAPQASASQSHSTTSFPMSSQTSSSSSLGGEEASGKRRAPEAATVLTTFSPGLYLFYMI
jgi:hypothetical protein